MNKKHEVCLKIYKLKSNFSSINHQLIQLSKKKDRKKLCFSVLPVHRSACKRRETGSSPFHHSDHTFDSI